MGRHRSVLRKLRPYHGAGILFWVRDGKGDLHVLLGERKYNPQQGKWSIPGGGWETDDSYDGNGKPNYLRTAIRESWEEIGFTEDDPEQLDCLWGRHMPFFHFVVYSRQLPRQVKIERYWEFSAVQWFPVESLPVECVWFVRSQVARLVRQQPKEVHPNG